MDNDARGGSSPAIATNMTKPMRHSRGNFLPDRCRAFAGRLTESNASDSAFARSRVVMHVRECSPGEVRIPLHVGEDRSRTWVITPTGSGLRLKHDHRH